MPKHFHRELEKLKKRVLTLGAMVEERVYMATKAIENRDSNLADKIIKSDYEIDEVEVDVEEECLKILALYQPVAVDLRIADEAVNIARGVKYIAKGKKLHLDFDFHSMAEKTEAMLKKSLDALVNLDVDLAFKVCLLDDEVDKINAEAHRIVKDGIKDNPDQGEYFLNLLLISRHLERIADHATNIAEEVIYLIEGEIVRHGKF
jgi:phosphate transport system protein